MLRQVLVSVIHRSMQAVTSDKKGWECALSRILVAKTWAVADFLANPTPRQCCSQVRRKVHAFDRKSSQHLSAIVATKNETNCLRHQCQGEVCVVESYSRLLRRSFWDVTQGKEAKSYWAVARWWDKVPFRFGWICWSLFSPLSFKFGWALVLPNNSKKLSIWEHMKIIPVDIRRKWCDQ